VSQPETSNKPEAKEFAINYLKQNEPNKLVHITSYYNSTEPFEVRVSDIAYARVGFCVWDKTLPQPTI
jgi:hypothetical protein